MKTKLIVCVVALAICLTFPFSWAAAPPSPCEPAPVVKKALDRLSARTDGLYGTDRAQIELPRLAVLLKRYPDDIHVHGRYQDVRQGAMPRGDPRLVEEYRVRLEKRPDDPRALYLYGRVLVDVLDRQAEAIEHLERATERDPSLALAHDEAARLYSRTRTRDSRRKMASHLSRVIDLCPESLLGYSLLGETGDRDLMARGAARLRERLSKETHRGSLRLYETLWKLEFKTLPPAEHDALRQTIGKDLARLRALKTKDANEYWFQFLHAGYDLAGDQKGLAWSEEEILRRFPDTTEAEIVERERFDRAHPIPAPGDEEGLRAYHLALLGLAQERTRRSPDDLNAWFDRLLALSELEGMPREEIIATADGTLKALETSPVGLMFYPPLRLQAAQLLLANDVRLEIVPGLAESVIQEEEREAQAASNQPTEEGDEESRAFEEENRRSVLSQARAVQLEALIRTQQAGKARPVLEKMAEDLQKSAPGPGAQARRQRAFAARRHEYWRAAGILFEAEGRRLDALAAYQNALLAIPRREPNRDTKEASELLARSERLWRELGGGDPGWQAWREAPAVAWVPEADPEAIEWETVEEPLPDFSLQDIEGRTWTLADLKGKTTLVNIWTVWCGPCRAELPYLQKLQERLKGRKDLQVLTLNVDENPGSVAPFVKDGAYTFPALLAEFYVSVTMGRSGIPRNWIVDRDGTLKFESIGFGGNGERWVEDMLKLLETSGGS